MSDAESKDTTPAEPSEKPTSRKHKWLKRTSIIAVILLLLGGLLLLLAPTLASTGPIRGMVVSAINAKLNGTVEIESWSLGWFSNQTVNTITVTDTQGELVASINKVTIPRGILGLLGSEKNLGTIIIEAPKANIAIRPDGTINLSDLLPPDTGADAPSPSKPSSPPEPLGFDLKGAIVIKDGAITMMPEGQPSLTITDLQMTTTLDGLSNPIIIEQSALLGNGKAPLKSKVSVKALTNGVINLEALEVDADVSVTNFDLQSVAGLLTLYDVPLAAEGLLTTDITAQVRGTNALTAQGKATVSALALSGKALKNDTFRARTAAAAYDVSLKNGTLNLKKMSASAPGMGSGNIEGIIELDSLATLYTDQAAPSINLAVRGDANLPAIVNQLPTLLQLRDGLKLESGKATLALNIRSEAGGLRIDSTGGLSEVAAISGGKRVALEQPVRATLRASLKGRTPRIGKLFIASSFCNLKGSGGLDAFTFDMDMDVDAAMREAGKFVDLQDREASGKLVIHADITGADQRRKRVRTTIDLTRLSLAGITPQPIRLARTLARLDAELALREDYSPQGLHKIKGVLNNDLLKSTLTVASVRLEKAGLPTITDARVDGSADIDRLLAFARSIGVVPDDLKTLAAKGGIRWDIRANCKDGNILAHEIATVVKGLDVALDGKRLHEPKLTIRGSAGIAPETRSILVHKMNATFSAGTTTLSNAAVPDWSAPDQKSRAKITGDLGLPKLLAMAGDFVTVPEEMNVYGRASFDMALTASLPKARAIATVDVYDLEIDSRDTQLPPFTEKRMTFTAHATIDTEAKRLNLSKLAIDSETVALNGAASLIDWSGIQLLAVSGTHTIDFAKVGPLVAAMTDQKIEMEGKEARRFAVTAKLGEEDWRKLLAEAMADTSVHMKSITALGITTGEVDMPLTVKDGLIRFGVRTRAEGGQLNLPLTINLLDDGGYIEIPKDTAILDEVGLTTELAQGLIAMVHPLFEKSAVSDGKVGYLSKRLRIPLKHGMAEAPLHADIAGTLQLKEITLGSAGMLEGVLKAVRLSKYRITLPTQSIPVALKGGGLKLEPLRIKVDRYDILLHGTSRFRKAMGPDGKPAIVQELNMMADVPLTRELVRRFTKDEKIYDILKGEVLRIPIRGTSSAPKIAREVIEANVERLVKNALPKIVESTLQELLRRQLEKRRKKEEKKRKEKEEEREKDDPDDALKEAGRKALEKALEGLF
jgi:hypothetical protein